MKHERFGLTKTALSLAAAALSLPAIAAAQSQQQDQAAIRQSQTIAESTDADAISRTLNATPIHRVSKEAIERKVTADELLGKTVVDSDGVEVGTVEDIGLNAAFTRMTSFVRDGDDPQRPQRARPSASDGVRREPGAEIGEAGYTIGATDQDLPASPEERNEAFSDPQNPGSAGTVNVGEPQVAPAYTFEEDEVQFYVSYGEDHLLEIPASLLSFNDSDDRIELSITKAALEAIAAGRAVSLAE